MKRLIAVLTVVAFASVLPLQAADQSNGKAKDKDKAGEKAGDKGCCPAKKGCCPKDGGAKECPVKDKAPESK